VIDSKGIPVDTGTQLPLATNLESTIIDGRPSSPESDNDNQLQNNNDAVWEIECSIPIKDILRYILLLEAKKSKENLIWLSVVVKQQTGEFVSATIGRRTLSTEEEP
jgi:hypothetical protein